MTGVAKVRTLRVATSEPVDRLAKLPVDAETGLNADALNCSCCAPPAKPAGSSRQSRRVISAITGGVSLAAALMLGLLDADSMLVTAMLFVSSIAGGWYVVPAGLRAARSRRLDMSFLMTVAAMGAWLIGEQAEAASTLFLFALAELLESHSMGRARDAIRGLMALSPAEASVRREGVEMRVPASGVAVAEIVVVRPGEKIAVDGIVIAGRSSVNQATITGESMPVDVAIDDVVFAGTINLHGALDVRSTRPASDTTLARIIHAVSVAQASRAPSQTFVDRFARIYTPVVVALAVVVAILPPALGFGSFDTWIYRALAMLVVACPCALVISTPVTFVSGLARAARGGVLIKGGAFLEKAGAISTVCFDKTGTLTRGTPVVTDIWPIGQFSEATVLSMAAAIEQHSEHPLARAILRTATERGIDVTASTDFESMPGRGARAMIDGRPVYLGNARLAGELGVSEAAVAEGFDRFAAAGQTAVLLIAEGAPLDFISIADEIRPNARAAVDELRAAGISRLVMLTGDNEGTARAVSETLGLDKFYAGLLPEDKVRIVRELEASGEHLAFVGDGVNDAPALASASVGVAMGAAGTDIALETADIALMGDDLSKLAFAMRVSRQTMSLLRQNIVFALVIKAVFLVLAAGGWATLWMAVAADMGASLAVVLNGLRVLRLDDPG